MNGLAMQAWAPYKTGDAPSGEWFASVEPSERARVKPRGGFWTSTYDERHGSGWVQWCLDEEFRCDRRNPTFALWLLEPDPSARVYTIDTYGDLERLCESHGKTNHPYGVISDTYPDWARIAADYDAVHLTDAGQWATRLSHPLGLYGWDCESTLWLRWAFVSVTDLGLVRCGRAEVEASA